MVYSWTDRVFPNKFKLIKIKEKFLYPQNNNIWEHKEMAVSWFVERLNILKTTRTVSFGFTIISELTSDSIHNFHCKAFKARPEESGFHVQVLSLVTQHTGKTTKSEIHPIARMVNRFCHKVNCNELVETAWNSVLQLIIHICHKHKCQISFKPNLDDL